MGERVDQPDCDFLRRFSASPLLHPDESMKGERAEFERMSNGAAS
jgi:hypothetical protein